MHRTTKIAALMALTVAAISSGGAFAIMQDVQPPQITDDNAAILGHIVLVVRNADGDITEYRQTDNEVVTNGLESAVNGLFGTQLFATSDTTPEGIFDTIGVGTGSTGVAAGNVDLETQRAGKLIDGTIDPSGSSAAVIAVTFPSTGSSGSIQNATSGTIAITESGLFDSTTNATSASNLFARQTFSAINVGGSDTLTVTWTITFASAP